MECRSPSERAVHVIGKDTPRHMFRSAEITGTGAPGVSSGQAIQHMEQMARQSLPPGFDFAWAGQSLEEIKAGSQAGYIFALSILIVYLVLAAQYESWILPLIILLGVPLAVLGALSAQFLRGFANDVFCQVGLVMPGPLPRFRPISGSRAGHRAIYPANWCARRSTRRRWRHSA